jgi:glycosyltransferase involved in cell wall biosynthesis
MKSSIHIVSHGPFTKIGDIYYSHNAKADFVNDLSNYYNRVYVYTDIISHNHPDYELISQRSISSPKVEVIPFWHDSGVDEQGVIRSFVKYFKFVRGLMNDYNKWQNLFLFQSFYSIITLTLIKLFRNDFKVTLYIAGNIFLSFSYRKKSRFRFIRSILKLINQYYLKHVVSRADIVLVHGDEAYLEYSKENLNVHHVIPMRAKYSSAIGELPKLYTFLFVGSLIQSKGVEFLLQAIKALKSKGIDASLLVVGTGPEAKSLKETSLKLGINNQVKFTGFISESRELGKIYRQSMMLVLPSLTEGFPRVIYEAIENNILIIASDAGGITGLINHLENGIVVPVEKLDKLDEYLANALSLSTTARDNMIKQAKEDLNKKFSVLDYESTAQQVHNLMANPNHA